MPVPDGGKHRKAPEGLPDAARTPWELRISRRSAGSRIGQRPWGAGSTRSGSPSRRERSARGETGARASGRSGDDVLRRGFECPGTTAVGPGRTGSSPPARLRSFRPRIPQSTRLWSTADDGVQWTSRDVPASPPERTLRTTNPRSGSGPSESARPKGEQTVETVRDREDGWCRAGQARVIRIPSPMSLEGRETPGGATRPGMAGEGPAARTLRGRRSLRERAGRSSDRPDGRTAEHLVVVKTNVEEAANQ
jgi:hypothetical protein